MRAAADDFILTAEGDGLCWLWPGSHDQALVRHGEKLRRPMSTDAGTIAIPENSWLQWATGLVLRSNGLGSIDR